MSHSKEALAEQSFLVDHAGGISVITLAEPSLREHLAAIVGNRLLETAHHCGGMMILKHDLVREFSSAWINELLRLTVHCSGLGGHLIATGLNPNGIQILRTTGLDKRLNLADHEAAAREMFALRSSDDGASVLAWLFGKPRQSGRAA
jgi:anti-anti-sigma regulatory factor